MRVIFIFLAFIGAIFSGLCEGQESDIYHTKIDNADVYVISLKSSDVDKKILLPNNEVQKDFIDSKQLPQNRHNVVLIKAKNFIALIDTGFKNTQETLKVRLNELKVPLDSITHVIITHGHPDHIGGILDTSGKNNFKNATLVIDKIESDYWQSAGDSGALARESIKAFKNVSFINHDKYLIDSDSIKLRALRAYGHTPGHNLISVGDNFIFVADLFHVFDVQIKMPNIAVIYDVDKTLAVRVRENYISEFKRDNTQIVGAHTPFTTPISLKE